MPRLSIKKSSMLIPAKRQGLSRSKIDAKWRSQKEPTMPEIKKVIKRMVRAPVEGKFFDTQFSLTATTSGQIFQMTNVPQGDTDQTRDGDQLTPTSLECRGEWLGGDSTNTCRFIIFKWKPTINSFFPSVATSTNGILQSVGGFSPFAPYNHDIVVNGKNATILWDQYFDIQTNTATTINKHFNFTIRKGLSKMQFVSGGTSSTNQLCGLIISDSAALPNPGFVASFRLNYTDA